MSDLTLGFSAATITAAAKDTRMIRGTIVPYGEYGATSAGLVKIRAGALTLPADPKHVLLRDEHSPMGTDVGVATELTDSATSLTGAFRVARKPEGDQLLADADPEVPLKGGLSVELSSVVFADDEPDTVASARLVRVAAVGVPAFTSSRVASVAASHTQEEPPVTTTVIADPKVELTAGTPLEQLAKLVAAELAAAAAPEGLVLPGQTGKGGLTASRIASLYAAAYRGDVDRTELTAALTDITRTANPDVGAPEYAGELWSGATYVRRFVPLVTQKVLKSWKGTGWRFVTKPQLADYAGDKGAVPSNPVTTEADEWEATRCAGAWDIDRKFVDFRDDEFWASFHQATTDSYRQLSDQRVIDFIVASAIAAEGIAGKPAYLAAQPDVLRGAAVLGAYMEDLANVGQRPDYIAMNTAEWLGLLDITGLDVPAFLELLGIKPSQFQASNKVPAGRIIAGAKAAVEFRELGDVPIRVSALDIARGGVDEGAFGYTSLFLARPGGVLSLPITPVVG